MRVGLKWAALLAVGVAGAALAAPVPDDFAEGMPLEPAAPGSAYRLPLPEAVYGLSTREDLGDLRVFNQAGQVVQHALCAPPAPSAPTARPVPAHGLPAGRGDKESGERFSLETADGLRLRWGQDDPARVASAPGAFEYILDARDLDAPLTGVRLDWQWRSPQGRAELPIRLEASDNLEQWRTVVPRTTLLRVEGSLADGEALETGSVTLPERRYRFLRLVPLDERARDWLQGASVLFRPAGEDSASLSWVAAERAPGPDADGARQYRSARPLAVRQWRLRLPGPNRVVGVSLSSRASEDAPWRPRFQGAVASGPDRSLSSAHPAGGVSDRFWRLRILSGEESLGDAPVTLELGYVPLELGFLAQGQGPFLLAYGSGTAPPAQRIDCARLGTAPAAARARPEQRRELGGPAALRPAPEPLPTRRIVLWGVLILGAGLVGAMAVALLRKLRP